MSTVEEFCVECGYFLKEKHAKQHERAGHEVMSIDMDIFDGRSN